MLGQADGAGIVVAVGDALVQRDAQLQLFAHALEAVFIVFRGFEFFADDHPLILTTKMAYWRLLIHF